MLVCCTTDFQSVEGGGWGDGLEVHRTVLIIGEIPADRFPVGMNPPQPLINRQSRIFWVLSDVLHNVPEMFFVTDNAVVTLFLPQTSGSSEFPVHTQRDVLFNPLKAVFQLVAIERFK